MSRSFLVLLILFFSFGANAQNIFMKIDGVEGDVVVKGHENEFSILAFELVTTTTTTPGGGGSGSTKASFGEAKLKKFLAPKPNPDIMLMLSKGTHIKDVTIQFTKNSGSGLFTYYQVKLSDVLITGVSILSPECQGGGCNNFYEEIHLNYSKIEWTGYPVNPNGTPGTPITRGWDVIKNTQL